MAFDPVACARSLLGGDAAATADLPVGDADRLAVVWALKDKGYAAIYGDPSAARAAASCIRTLADGLAAPAARDEAAAVEDWLAGAADALDGQAAAAIDRLDTAYRLFLALGRTAQAAATQVPKVVALSMRGDHDAALDCAQRTLRQFLEAGDLLAAGKLEINLGSMLLRQDRYADAAQHYRRASVHFARVRERPHSVLADVGLAGALSWLHAFDEAERLYERVDARIRAHGLTSLQGLAWLNRGMLELSRNRHADALHWLGRALRDAEANGPPQRLADAQTQLANAYLAVNLLPEAAALYGQAIDSCGRIEAPLEQAWATVQLGTAQARLGNRPQAAATLAVARTRFEALGNATGVAHVHLQVAAMRLDDGDATDALDAVDRAMTALDEGGTRSVRLDARILRARALHHLGRVDEARSAFAHARSDAQGLPELQARCDGGLGLLALHAGDMDEASRRLTAAADAFDALQAILPDDEFRTAYAADKADVHDALLALALRSESARRCAAVLEAIERTRARALRHDARAEAVAPTPAWPPALRHLREALRWLQLQARQAVSSGEAARARALETRGEALEVEFLEAHRRWQAARVAEPARPQRDMVLDLPALQATLGERQAVVAYAWLGHELTIAVVRRDGLHLASVGSQGLERTIEQLRFQVDSLRFGAPALARHGAQILARTRAHLRALHERLWTPVAPWLEGVDDVVVVPHRALHYVPFAALDDGASALCDRLAVTVAPSLAGIAGLAGDDRTPPGGARVVVVGVGGDSLPHVRAEVDAVAGVHGAAAVVLRDAAATQPALREALAGASVLHLACHGHFRADSPYFSSLRLGDGDLTLRDAATLPLAGVRVVLSACETGVSRVAPGDEWVGLVRGFLLAGAREVTASLWTVDDASTADLMARYHQGLTQGVPAARALREAQCTVRATHPHPYHWAPFTVCARR